MKISWLLLGGMLMAGAALADSPATDQEPNACGHGQERMEQALPGAEGKV
jgi:hypothetical protein